MMMLILKPLRTSLLPALIPVIAVAILAASPSLAVPITYTEEATASGSLGGVVFTNADVVPSMTNDTNNVAMFSSSYFSNAGSATVTVAGGAPATFTHSVIVYPTLTLLFHLGLIWDLATRHSGGLLYSKLSFRGS